MKFTAEDLRRIRWNLALLLVFAVLGAVAVYATLRYAKDAQQVYRQASGKRDEISTKLAHARDEERELRQKFSEYQNIMARGYIGNEHRLDWIEQIRKIKTARKLLDIQYELAPQQLLDSGNPNPPAPGSPGARPANAPAAPAIADTGNIIGYDFMVSNMQLHMQLLHEDDLLNFLSDLRGSVQAYLRVNKCDVQRFSSPGSTAQLKADCSIDWITLREKRPGQT
ncbi:MAG: hypothetical protein HY066_00350 [Betaproteobacteria bacterium]|nr:hypothetical protein [Betaproteobacteria bacterium]